MWTSVVFVILVASAGYVKPEDDICLTEECVKAAGMILLLRDPTADPCDDFYQYVCGGYKMDNPVSPSRQELLMSDINRRLFKRQNDIRATPISDSDPVPVQQYKMKLAGCNDIGARNEKGLHPFIAFTDAIGGWPLGSLEDVSDYDWYLAASVSYMINAPTLLKFGITRAVNNTAEDVMQLFPPGSLGLLRTLESKLEITTTVATRAYEEKYGSAPDYESQHKMNEMIQSVGDLMRDLMHARNFSEKVTVTTVRELQEESDSVFSGGVDWKALLDTVYSEAGFTITEDSKVQIWHSYVVNLGKILHDHLTNDINVVANLVGALVFLQVGLELDMKSRHLLSGTLRPSSAECDIKAGEVLNTALDFALFKELGYGSKQKHQMTIMTEAIIESFQELLPLTSWMDDETRAEAAEKAEAIRKRISYPDFMDSEEKLTKHFEGLTVDAETHFDNVIYNRQWNLEQELKIRSANQSYNGWSFTPTTVNAAYFPTQNAIEIPAGISWTPFADLGLVVLGIAGLGSVAAHELTHAFDNTGRMFDKDGNMRQWWSAHAIEQYEKQAACFVEQYSNITLTRNNQSISLDGQMELGENIADNGGVIEAYNAYFSIYVKKYGEEAKLPAFEDYTAQQHFFLGYGSNWCANTGYEEAVNRIKGDPHALPKYRVNVPLSNFDEFAKAFNCPVGSPMNPEKKCFLW